MDTQDKSLLTFPCDFAIKVFGNDTPEFRTTVLDIMRQHVPAFTEDKIQTRPSSNGKYIALNIDVHAESKEQLDRIYQALSSSPNVIMAL
jgi:putative lipoic acid-binding regulatory protein